MVKVGDKAIAIFKLNEDLYAADNTCSHEGGPLSYGTVEGENVRCPLHGATFHITSGKTIELPAGEKMGPPVDKGITCYPVRAVGAELEIKI